MRPAPPEYKTHIYPMAQLGALKFDPDLTVLRQDNRSRTHKHEQRETLNKQRERQRKKCGLCVQVMNMTFLAARSAGCARMMDTGHRIVQRRVRRIETRGTENRRGEGG